MQTNWTIDAVAEALTSKKISARELAADYYKRIEARDPGLNAYLTLSKDRALAQAGRVERRGSSFAGNGYWRVDPSTGFVLRDPGHDAELRACVALWTDCFCFFARPHWTLCHECPRCRYRDASYRRTRRQRFHVHYC